jgi:hypothetical protein
MRPFRFFFALSLGLLLLFFMARFVVGALIIAAVMSTIFFVFRRMRNFFASMDWEESYPPYHNRFKQHPRALAQRYYEDGLVWDRPEKPAERLLSYRSIKVQ